MVSAPVTPTPEFVKHLKHLNSKKPAPTGKVWNKPFVTAWQRQGFHLVFLQSQPKGTWVLMIAPFKQRQLQNIKQLKNSKSHGIKSIQLLYKCWCILRFNKCYLNQVKIFSVIVICCIKMSDKATYLSDDVKISHDRTKLFKMFLKLNKLGLLALRVAMLDDLMVIFCIKISCI